MQLQSGRLLQGGKYRIERVLGQGGFGITYQAVQVALNRKVAIKEFFMKEYCNRDSETSHVSIPSEGSKELVGKFRQKFIKEAQNIAALNHPHIIRIHDIFEENGTAYYVMEYCDKGSLGDLVKRQGALDESEALRYIRQVADALGYIHERKMNHLDVKPGNILLDENRNAVLIDFGLSKRYDEEGNQTSTTPVGISHGYAPLEQYKKGGVGTFSPATDIYSLGATLYKLLTGQTPPEANDVMDDGLPALPSSVSSATASAIEKAMQSSKKNRPQSVAEFMSLLSGEGDDTVVPVDVKPAPHPDPSPAPHPDPTSAPSPVSPSSSWKKWAVPLTACVLVALAVLLWPKGGQDEKREDKVEASVAQSSTSQPASASSSKANVINGHKYVDLGLSVKWADCNIGASSPSDYGDYFAWGETSTKSDYSWATYEWCNGTYDSMTKYCINSKYGTVDNRKVLESSDDVARVKWGGSWRMPTVEEIKELYDRSKCTWTWTTQGGRKGYKVTGPNGNSIFLPAAGNRNGTGLFNRGSSGCYWSATLYENCSNSAYYLYFYSGGSYWDHWEFRGSGFTVRPVTE